MSTKAKTAKTASKVVAKPAPKSTPKAAPKVVQKKAPKAAPKKATTKKEKVGETVVPEKKDVVNAAPQEEEEIGEEDERDGKKTTQTLGEYFKLANGDALLQRAAETARVDEAFSVVRKSLQENGLHTLEDVLSLPAAPMNVKKLEKLLELPAAQAKVVLAVGDIIRNDLFPKCAIVKAELHAQALKDQEKERKQQERLKKRKGTGLKKIGSTAKKPKTAKKAGKKDEPSEDEDDEDYIDNEDDDDDEDEIVKTTRTKKASGSKTEPAESKVDVRPSDAIAILENASKSASETIEQAAALLTKSEVGSDAVQSDAPAMAVDHPVEVQPVAAEAATTSTSEPVRDDVSADSVVDAAASAAADVAAVVEVAVVVDAAAAGDAVASSDAAASGDVAAAGDVAAVGDAATVVEVAAASGDAAAADAAATGDAATVVDASAVVEVVASGDAAAVSQQAE